MPALRLAILGMEHPHALGLVEQIAKRPDLFDLVGGFDPQPKVANQRTATWQECSSGFRQFETAEQLLTTPLDAVVIEGATEQNVSWAQKSLERGLHVLLEKPAGLNFREFEAVSLLAQQSGLQLQMLYLFRYMSAVQYLLNAVSNNELGHVYQYRARLPKDYRLYDELVENYKHLPGGIFFEMACHAIDIMIAAMGEPLSVQSMTRHHGNDSDDFPDSAFPDSAFLNNGVALFEFPNAFGQIEVSALEIATDARRFEVYGTKGAIVIPNLGSGHLENAQFQRVEHYRAQPANAPTRQSGWESIDLPAATLQAADLVEFHARIVDNKPAEFNEQHDLAVQKWLVQSCGGETANE